MKAVNLSVIEVYEVLKKDYENWHDGCQSCKGGGDYSFACYMNNYLYRSGDNKRIYAYVFSGSGEEEILAEIELKDGKLIIVNDPRWYVAPWVTVEDILSLLSK